MRKILQLLAVLVIFALMGFCTTIGGFYTHEVLVEVKSEKVDEKIPEESSEDAEQPDVAETKEVTGPGEETEASIQEAEGEGVPIEGGEPEVVSETEVVKVALGDKIFDTLHLTKIRQKFGVEFIRRFAMIAGMVLGILQGFMLTRLLKCNHRREHHHHHHHDDVDHSQAIEGYPIPRDPNRLKF